MSPKRKSAAGGSSLKAWGVSKDVIGTLDQSRQKLILSLLDHIQVEGRNWERFKWLLQVTLPSHFGSPDGGQQGASTVNNVIKISVEDHKALAADYKQLSARADQLLGLTNPSTSSGESTNGETP